MAEQSDVDKGKSSNCQQFSSKLKKRIQQPHRGVKKSRRGRNLSKKSWWCIKSINIIKYSIQAV